MPILIACRCGQRLRAPDVSVGKAVRCPSCKTTLQVPGVVDVEVVEPRPMDDVGYVVKLGKIKTSIGSELAFSFHVESDGIAFLDIDALSDMEDDFQCVSLRLDDKNYENLKAVMSKVDEAVHRYRSGGPRRRMTEIYR